MSAPATQVCVVVPTLNPTADCLQRLHALKLQLSADLHWILIDDGSNNEARAAIGELSNSGFEVIHHTKNLGLPAARNTGIKAAKRAYVFPLDDDDSVVSEFFDLAVPIADATPALGFVYSWARVTGQNARTFECEPWSELALLKRNLCCASALIRRSAWEQVGGYNETLTNGLEDWDLWLKFATAGIRGELIAKPLFTYNQSDDSMLGQLTRSGDLWQTQELLVERHRGLYEQYLPQLIVELAKERANAQEGFIERNARRFLGWARQRR